MKTKAMKGMAVLVAAMTMLSTVEALATNSPPPTPPTQVIDQSGSCFNCTPIGTQNVIQPQGGNAASHSSSSASSAASASQSVAVQASGGQATATGGTSHATIQQGAVQNSVNPTATATVERGAVQTTITGPTVSPTTTSSVSNSGNSQNANTNDNRSSVAGSGNSSVTVVDASEDLNISPHAPFVNGIPTPTLFEHRMSQSGVSVPYLVEMARVCPPVFGASRDMRPQDEKGASWLTTVTALPYRPGAFGKARDSGPPVGVLEVGGFTGTQRFRCLGRVSVEGAPKKAEKAYFDTLMYDASEFTSRRVRASRVYLLFDRCTVSTSNGVMTFGRGMGASGGASDMFDSALATLNGGVSIGSGRTLTFTQVGVTFIAVEPTDDTGPGTFTFADLQPKVAQSVTPAPSETAKPGDLAQPLSGKNIR